MIELLIEMRQWHRKVVAYYFGSINAGIGELNNLNVRNVQDIPFYWLNLSPVRGTAYPEGRSG